MWARQPPQPHPATGCQSWLATGPASTEPDKPESCIRRGDGRGKSARAVARVGQFASLVHTRSVSPQHELVDTIGDRGGRRVPSASDGETARREKVIGTAPPLANEGPP